MFLKLFVLGLLGALGFTAWAIWDGYVPRDAQLTGVQIQTRVGTWHQLYFNSYAYWERDNLGHGNVIVRFEVDNSTDQIIREMTVTGVATISGRQLELFSEKCQFANSTYLTMHARRSYAVEGFGDDMVCFIKLDHRFPYDVDAGSLSNNDPKSRAELERVWALVNSVRVSDLRFEIKTSRQPLRYASWIAENWTAATSWLVSTISYPFQRV